MAQIPANTVEVEFNGQTINLHSAWDTKMIEANLQTVQQGVLEMCKRLTNADKIKIEKTNISEWVNQSRLFLPEVYKFKNGELSKEYLEKALPIIEAQLLFAGLRLANVLNETFKK